MPVSKINDLNIYYEVHGQGEPLLLIAGLGNDCQAWQFAINTLSNHFKTIIFDSRGVGRSDTPSAPYSVKEMAADTIALLDHLKIENAHIIGHCLGGFIAQEIAINNSHRVRKLILEATSPFTTRRNADLFMNFYDAWKSGMDMELWMKQLLYWLLSQKSVEDEKFFNSMLRYNLDYPYPQPIEGFLGHVQAFSNFNSSKELYRISSETLMLIGSDDILTLPGETELLYQGITRASYPIYIENAAHSIHLEQPKAFCNAVLGFLYKYVR